MPSALSTPFEAGQPTSDQGRKLTRSAMSSDDAARADGTFIRDHQEGVGVGLGIDIALDGLVLRPTSRVS
jgi:hypothetical protein